jgi:hypothetical protein
LVSIDRINLPVKKGHTTLWLSLAYLEQSGHHAAGGCRMVE